jgi:thiol-disulfide isomerase/thioredoxin
MIPAVRVSLLLALLATFPAAAISKPPQPPILRSDNSQFIFMEPTSPAPSVPLTGLNGAVMDFNQYRGRVVVLNFWATWCLPCATEMPSLDRLSATADPAKLTVIAVAIDQTGAASVAPYIASHHLTHLAVALDPEQRIASLSANHNVPTSLPLWGLPASFVVNKNGRVMGFITGATNWDSPRARSFLAFFMNSN